MLEIIIEDYNLKALKNEEFFLHKILISCNTKNQK